MADAVPVRQIAATRFALEGLNKDNLTDSYEVRVYRKGAPADAAPHVACGTDCQRELKSRIRRPQTRAPNRNEED